ncbi:hypothetical protein CVT24_000629 [Panaeolus cyanescens]|uniref:Uncharacterized protein n=1 Tax=Panaeolus cyanescens TaxID=181874 RepID=A0A409WPD2_9AGAR|nr:hypothetical protein CVT24_000629 [Panaeolus cyanescens]
MDADAKRVNLQREKEKKREELKSRRAAIILDTSSNLVLDVDVIQNSLVNDELNRQLDWHRDNELKHFPSDPAKVPLKSHMTKKADRVNELILAVARYNSRRSVAQVSIDSNDLEPNEGVLGSLPSEAEYDSEGSDFHDDYA